MHWTESRWFDYGLAVGLALAAVAIVGVLVWAATGKGAV